MENALSKIANSFTRRLSVVNSGERGGVVRPSVWSCTKERRRTVSTGCRGGAGGRRRTAGAGI